MAWPSLFPLGMQDAEPLPSRRGRRGLIALIDPAADPAAALPVAAPWRPGRPAGRLGAARPGARSAERGRRGADPGRRVGRPDGAYPRAAAVPAAGKAAAQPDHDHLRRWPPGQRSPGVRERRCGGDALRQPRRRSRGACSRSSGHRICRMAVPEAATRRPRRWSSRAPPGAGRGLAGAPSGFGPGGYPGLGNLGPWHGGGPGGGPRVSSLAPPLDPGDPGDLAPTPEPATLLLVGSNLALLGAAAWRRCRRRLGIPPIG